MERVLKVGQQSLLGYLPAIVIKEIIDGKLDYSSHLPAYSTINTVSLFADISGFTKLSEAFAIKGRIGPEFLAFSLNRYMEQLSICLIKLVNIISKNGGDIFKFAGDALLVVWPDSSNIEESCRRAIQCASDIQYKLNNREICRGKNLSIKIGIGVGEVRILFVGGQFNRCEYLIVGESIRQACEAETHALSGGETIVSSNVYEFVQKFCIFEEAADNPDYPASEDKYYKFIKLIGDRLPIKADAYLMRSRFAPEKLKSKLNSLRLFVPAAITIYLDIEKENWSKELRMLTIMFLNLKVDLSQTSSYEGLQRIQDIVRTVQKCVYKTRGSLNKFLMDDKGSVMLIAWGLPPFSYPDNPTRSVISAISLVNELKKFDCGAYIGITTGSCFTGVCGTIGGRREYSLLGEVVNLSARHMQNAIMNAKKTGQKYSILICEKTKNVNKYLTS